MNHPRTTLQELHDEYAEQVNLAVAEGRDDLVQGLADEFALAITKTGPAAARPTRARRRLNPHRS